MKRGLVLITVIVLGITGIWLDGVVQIPDPTVREILAATVQIVMYKPNPESDAGDEYLMVDGIGTLQVRQGQGWLVTHSHWDEYLVRAKVVQLRDSENGLLAVMDVAEFRRMIRYQDEGTLILKLTAELQEALLPAGVGSETIAMPDAEQRLQPGDVVQVTHQQADAPELITVREARVESMSRYGGVQTMQLSTLDGQPIVKGDSGGGIWFEGRLVGNMWASLYEAETMAPTGNGFAALVPFGQL